MSIPDRLAAALADRYRLEHPLGEGGMATVYRARDLRHDRDVAIKVLKPELAAVIGGERFLTEIRTTANLQHPHILPLFDSGEADSFLYYVMPYVNGESLRAKLDRERQLAVDESLRITKAVASALEYAHDHGVIHRDIKPENILIHAGQPVVADFGIALAISAAGGGRLTETGLSLGTPHYMSPEQATADRDLSARSDVYSLACVLYEMLAGDPPHTGPTAQSILMRILTESPRAVTDVRASVPPNVAAALARALEKLPADRFETADEFRRALDDPAFSYTAVRRTPPAGIVAPAATAAKRGFIPVAWAAAGIAVAVVAGVLGGMIFRGTPDPAPDPPALRLPLEVPGPPRGNPGVPLAISPTGEWIAWVPGGAAAPIWVRRSGETEFRALPGTEGANHPTFSPDEAWIAFVGDDGLSRVAPTGGPVLPVVPVAAVGNTNHPNWAADGTIVFTGGTGIYRVAGTGGEPQLLATAEEMGFTPIRPELLPGGRGLLVTRQGGGIVLFELGSRRSTVLSESGSHAHYVATGHVVFGVDPGALMALPFDPDRLQALGDAVTVLTGVVKSVTASGPVQFAVSRTGTAVYATGGAASTSQELVLVDLQGNTEILPVQAANIDAPRFSPDGRQITYQADTDIWVFDRVLGSNTRFTFDGGNLYPVWSRTGEYIYYGALDPPAVYRKQVAGDAAPERLAAVETGALFPRFESADGSKVMIRANSPDVTGRDLLLLNLADSSVTPWLAGDYDELQPALSPDGRWVAYQADPAGRNEIFVRSFPQPGEPFQISDAGGSGPVWGPGGDVIYYVAPGRVLMAARVRSDHGVTVVERREVARGALSSTSPGNRLVRSYDIAPDGSRFVFFRAVGSTDPDANQPDVEARPEITVVANWFTELKQRMGR